MLKLMLREGLAWVLVCVFGELEIGAAVHVVVLVENPDRPVDLETGHHQLHDMGWDWVWELNAVELLEDSGPLQSDILVRVVGLSVDAPALAHGLMHEFIVAGHIAQFGLLAIAWACL